MIDFKSRNSVEDLLEDRSRFEMVVSLLGPIGDQYLNFLFGREAAWDERSNKENGECEKAFLHGWHQV